MACFHLWSKNGEMSIYGSYPHPKYTDVLMTNDSMTNSMTQCLEQFRKGLLPISRLSTAFLMCVGRCNPVPLWTVRPLVLTSATPSEHLRFSSSKYDHPGAISICFNTLLLILLLLLLLLLLLGAAGDVLVCVLLPSWFDAYKDKSCCPAIAHIVALQSRAHRYW